MRHLIWVLVLVNLLPASSKGQKWTAFKDPGEAGFSTEKLDKAEQYFKEKGGSALLVIYKGHVLLSSGHTTQRFMVHSMRKSFLSALYGINIRKIDTAATLDKLHVNDLHGLSEIEKKATVSDLLKARSGIYLPSAYSTTSMETNLPVRGSHLPGTYWYYNNWDFNVLGTIFNQTTKLDLFEAFQKQIAGPIGMEDYRTEDSYYRLETEKSDHPAYLFKMSARDLARFGLLYLQKGKWNNKQLIPESWINVSTKIHSPNPDQFSTEKGYGMLWWIDNNKAGESIFYASGLNGHRLYILPKSDLVIVHRTDTYQNKNVREPVLDTLITMILESKDGKAGKKPLLTNYEPQLQSYSENYKISRDLLSQYFGNYQHRQLGQMTIQEQGEKIVLLTNVGMFRIFAKSDAQFIVGDMEILLEFKKAQGNEKAGTCSAVLNQKKEIEKVIFFY